MLFEKANNVISGKTALRVVLTIIISYIIGKTKINTNKFHNPKKMTHFF